MQQEDSVDYVQLISVTKSMVPTPVVDLEAPKPPAPTSQKRQEPPAQVIDLESPLLPPPTNRKHQALTRPDGKVAAQQTPSNKAAAQQTPSKAAAPQHTASKISAADRVEEYGARGHRLMVAPDGKLMCPYCLCDLRPERKSSIDEHLASAKHFTALSDAKKSVLMDSAVSGR